VAIVPCVLDADECTQIINGMWKFLTEISTNWPTRIRKQKPESWKEYLNLHPLRMIMLQQYSIGQAQHLWNVRQNPKIVNIFSQFWNVAPEDLLASFDGCSFSIPNICSESQISNAEKSWYHLDQSLTRPNFETIQAWVSAYDTIEGDGTLAFLEGSHHYFEEFGNSLTNKSESDWMLFSPDNLEFYLSRGCQEKRIKCPAGSLVIWDSRVVHYGMPPTTRGENEHFRLVSYITYMPRYQATTEQINNKIKAFENMNTTSHHPIRFSVFPKKPRYKTLKYEITPAAPPVLTELGRRLVGYDA